MRDLQVKDFNRQPGLGPYFDCFPDPIENAGSFVPGSTRTVSILLTRRRTRIVFGARGPGKSQRDRDRFIVVKAAAD